MTAYSVATNGSNSNPGTPAQPWADPEYAKNTMASGDVALLNNGTYTYTYGWQIDTDNIALVAVNGRQATIHCSGSALSWAHIAVEAHDFRIQGIRMTQTGVGSPTTDCCIRWFSGDRGIVRDCALLDAQLPLKLQHSHNHTIEFCTIRNTPTGDACLDLLRSYGSVARWCDIEMAGANYGAYCKSGCRDCVFDGLWVKKVGGSNGGRAITLGGNSDSGTQEDNTREAENCININFLITNVSGRVDEALCIVGGRNCWHANGVVVGAQHCILANPSNSSGDLRNWPGVTYVDNPHWVNVSWVGCDNWDAAYDVNSGGGTATQNCHWQAPPSGIPTGNGNITGTAGFVGGSDYHTVAGSILRGAGRALPTIPKFAGGSHTAQTLDRDGNLRTGAWDIGLYQSGSAPTPSTPPAGGPDPVRQARTAQVASDSAVSVSLTGVLAGSEIVVGCVSYGFGNTVAHATGAVTDSAGQAYTRAAYADPGNLKGSLWYAPNHPGGDIAITFTPTGGTPTSLDILVAEVTGVVAGTAIADGASAQFGAGVTEGAPSLTPTTGNSIYFLLGAHQGGGSAQPDSPTLTITTASKAITGAPDTLPAFLGWQRVAGTAALAPTAIWHDAAWTTCALLLKASAVDTVAPVITAGPTAGVTPNTAVVTFFTDEAADTEVEWGPTTAYGATSGVRDTVTRVTSHTYTITGLSSDTLYHFRVKTRDAAGNLTTSADGTFRTSASADVIAPTISNIVVDQITQSGARISWKTDEPADTQLEYGATTAYGVVAPTTPADTSPRVTTHSVTLTGLTADAPYHARVRARDAAGNLGTSADVTFRTLTAPVATVPIITGISPASGPEGKPSFTLTVTGTGFVPGSVVRWNGASRATTYVSATRLTAVILASDVAAYGTAEVTVTNP